MENRYHALNSRYLTNFYSPEHFGQSDSEKKGWKDRERSQKMMVMTSFGKGLAIKEVNGINCTRVGKAICVVYSTSVSLSLLYYC